MRRSFPINQNVGDWVVRCVQTAVKSPAPCEVLQVTDQQRQQAAAFEPPSRSPMFQAVIAAMQVVVPAGVALGKGLLQLGPSTQGLKFTRCEIDGCYVESVVDYDDSPDPDQCR